jgi:hypothetical protein
MTNGNGNRDGELELIRQLLIATANRAEATDERLDRLVESQERTQRQLDQLSGKVGQLTENVDTAFQTIGLMSQNIDRQMVEFRSAILENQEESRRIWQYLMGQQQNGNEPQS